MHVVYRQQAGKQRLPRLGQVVQVRQAALKNICWEVSATFQHESTHAGNERRARRRARCRCRCRCQAATGLQANACETVQTLSHCTYTRQPHTTKRLCCQSGPVRAAGVAGAALNWRPERGLILPADLQAAGGCVVLQTIGVAGSQQRSCSENIGRLWGQKELSLQQCRQ